MDSGVTAATQAWNLSSVQVRSFSTSGFVANVFIRDRLDANKQAGVTCVMLLINQVHLNSIIRWAMQYRVRFGSRTTGPINNRKSPCSNLVALPSCINERSVHTILRRCSRAAFSLHFSIPLCEAFYRFHFQFLIRTRLELSKQEESFVYVDNVCICSTCYGRAKVYAVGIQNVVKTKSAC